MFNVNEPQGMGDIYQDFFILPGSSDSLPILSIDSERLARVSLDPGPAPTHPASRDRSWGCWSRSRTGCRWGGQGPGQGSCRPELGRPRVPGLSLLADK